MFFFLCGNVQLWDVASDQTVVDLIQNDTNAQESSNKLLQYALEHRSTDNITVFVLKFWCVLLVYQTLYFVYIHSLRFYLHFDFFFLPSLYNCNISFLFCFLFLKQICSLLFLYPPAINLILFFDIFDISSLKIEWSLLRWLQPLSQNRLNRQNKSLWAKKKNFDLK